MKKYIMDVLVFGGILFNIWSCGQESAKRFQALNLNAGNELTVIPDWEVSPALFRFKISLDGKWSFAPKGYPSREVDVPCFWEAIPDGKFDVQCPGYLEGTPDQGLTAFEFNPDVWDKRKIHQGTYSKTFFIPPGYENAKIWFESIHHQADVFLNNKKIGSHTGPYLRVGMDVNGNSHIGQNTIRVDLTDGTALLEKQSAAHNIIKKLGLSLGQNILEKIRPNLKRPIPDRPVGNYSYADATGLYRSVGVELLPLVFVEDVFIVPSVRRKDLTIEFAVRNTKNENLTIWLTARVKPAATGNEQPWTTGLHPLDIPANTSVKYVIMEPWAREGKLWSPQSPNLYNLETLLVDKNGNSKDFRRDRFGFREIWIENGDYILNGQKINLLGDSINVQGQWKKDWAKRYLSCDTARETFQNLRGLNINFVRFHTAPPENCIFDLADEVGLLTMAESAIHARMDTFPPFSIDDTYLNNARSWLESWVKEKRNHPSIIIWSVENEMFLFGMPMLRKEAFSLGDIVKRNDVIYRPDDTFSASRPINWDGDSSFLYRAVVPKRVDIALWANNLPGVLAAIHAKLNAEDKTFPVETINWHYPYDQWNTVDPEVEWYDKPIDHLRPYFLVNLPSGIGEIMFDRRHKLDQLPEVTFNRVKAMEAQTVRAARIIGYDDVRPFQFHWAWPKYKPDGSESPQEKYYHHLYTQEERDRLVKLVQDSYHPIAAFDYDFTNMAPNKDGTIGPALVQANAKITRTLVIMNDSFNPDLPITVNWKIVDIEDHRDLASDKFEVKILQGFSDSSKKTVFQSPPAGHRLRMTVKTHMEGLASGDFEINYDFLTQSGSKD